MHAPVQHTERIGVEVGKALTQDLKRECYPFCIHARGVAVRQRQVERQRVKVRNGFGDLTHNALPHRLVEDHLQGVEQINQGDGHSENASTARRSSTDTALSRFRRVARRSASAL